MAKIGGLTAWAPISPSVGEAKEPHPNDSPDYQGRDLELFCPGVFSLGTAEETETEDPSPGTEGAFEFRLILVGPIFTTSYNSGLQPDFSQMSGESARFLRDRSKVNKREPNTAQSGS